MIDGMGNGELDLSSGVPLYRQIKNILRTEIAEGTADARTPLTEAQLLERFGVSRAPIRQALNELTNEGYVYRKQGKGTFPVTGARVDRPADVRPGELYQYLRERGLDPTSTVSDLARVDPPPPVRRRLGIDAGERVLHFTRLIALDGEPFAQMDVYVRTPEGFAPTQDDLVAAGSVFTLLADQFGIRLERSEHEAWATAATPEQAAALGVDENAPLLVIDTLFIATGGVPVGWRSAVHRPEDFKFHFVMEHPRTDSH